MERRLLRSGVRTGKRALGRPVALPNPAKTGKVGRRQGWQHCLHWPERTVAQTAGFGVRAPLAGRGARMAGAPRGTVQGRRHLEGACNGPRDGRFPPRMSSAGQFQTVYCTRPTRFPSLVLAGRAMVSLLPWRTPAVQHWERPWMARWDHPFWTHRADRHVVWQLRRLRRVPTCHGRPTATLAM